MRLVQALSAYQRTMTTSEHLRESKIVLMGTVGQAQHLEPVANADFLFQDNS